MAKRKKSKRLFVTRYRSLRTGRFVAKPKSKGSLRSKNIRKERGRIVTARAVGSVKTSSRPLPPGFTDFRGARYLGEKIYGVNQNFHRHIWSIPFKRSGKEWFHDPKAVESVLEYEASLGSSIFLIYFHVVFRGETEDDDVWFRATDLRFVDDPGIAGQTNRAITKKLGMYTLRRVLDIHLQVERNPAKHIIYGHKKPKGPRLPREKQKVKRKKVKR